jgi:hypothetical protein
MLGDQHSQAFETIGLGKALREFPSLAVPLAVSYAVLASLEPLVPFARVLPTNASQLLLLIGAAGARRHPVCLGRPARSTSL